LAIAAGLKKGGFCEIPGLRSSVSGVIKVRLHSKEANNSMAVGT
jgi:hypothetical protein